MHIQHGIKAWLFAGLISAFAGGALAQSDDGVGAQAQSGAESAQMAAQRVTEALSVVRQIEAEPRMKQLLQQAKGVMIVPAYGRAALGVGAHGGAGLLLLKRPDGSWSGPAFYNMGGLTVGLQAGVAGGAMVMVLNNDKAVREFMKKNNFSLSADAGLTVVNWSKLAQSTAGVNDIRFNQRMTNAYYGRALWPQDIADGTVNNPQAESLQQALGDVSTVTRQGPPGRP